MDFTPGNLACARNYAGLRPGGTLTVAGLTTKVKSAQLYASKRNVQFDQDRFRVRFTGLPATPPDDPLTVLAVECESEPIQDMDFVRKEHPREKS